MIPLIKIRLTKIKRRICINLFIFLFPPIFILLFNPLINLLSSKGNEMPEEDQSKEVDLTTGFSVSSTIAIICENKGSEHCGNFTDYMKNKFSTYKEYNSYSEVTNEINTGTKFEFIFILKEKGDLIDFDVRFNNNNFKSVYESSNELHLGGSGDYSAITSYEKIQKIIYQYVTSINSDKQLPKISLKRIELTCPPIYNGYSKNLTSELVPVIISIGQAIALFNIMSWMISEREQKIDDFIKRQGISNTTYLFSWFFTYLILTIIPCILSSILLQLFFFYHFLFFWILLIEILFVLSIFCLAFFIQSYINKAQTGSLLMKVIILSISVLSIAVIKPEVTLFSKLVFCLFPQVTHVFGLQMLFELDNFITGIDFHLLFTGHNGLSLGAVLILIIVISLLYIVGAILIINNKMKGTVKRGAETKLFQEKENDIIVNHQELLGHNLQLKQSGELLEIKQVSRLYGDLKAVNEFSAELFKGEIFCLLGHNGAGKTTLIKMISGLEDPNEGDILLDGRSTLANKEYLFRNLGLCAQEDIFFEYLTVSEHLRYMCEIKGVPVNDFEINSLLTRIALVDKMNAICSTLSGGQKRKLCIALALIGNSKLILLDEPTSGMDIVAKRELWEFLKNYKENKIIVLTTHSLDEAEYLGDRIGIMSEGRFICSGSSSYLKSKYPCGFNINFIFDPQKFTQANRPALVETLKQIDNSCQVKVSSKFVFTINFPNITMNSSQLFENIDNVKESYGISNYTLSTTTLEDVFLKLNKSNESDINNTGSNLIINEVSSLSNNINKDEMRKNTSFCKQVGFGMKRYSLSLMRNLWLFILELVSSSAVVYVYGIGFYQLLSTDKLTLQSLNYLLTHNDVYAFTKEEVPFKLDESTFYREELDKDVNFVSLEQYGVTPEMTIETVASTLYDNHKYKTIQSAIFHQTNETDDSISLYILYSPSASDFYQSSMNLAMSALFEEYLNVTITMGTSFASIPKKKKNLSDQISDLLKMILCLLLVLVGYYSYSSFILITPLTERITNLKHLLYLSGANMGAYWLSVYFMEVLKTLCLLIILTPIYLYMEWKLLLTFPLIICFTFSLVAYCCCWSFILRKVEQAQTYFLAINMLMLLIQYILTIIVLQSLSSSSLMINFYDLNPISSFSYHLFRLGFSAYLSNNDTLTIDEDILKALLNGCAVMLFLTLIYVLLLMLLEKRVLGRCWNSLLGCTSFNKESNYEYGTPTDVNMYNMNPVYGNQKQIEPQRQEMQLQIQDALTPLETQPQQLQQPFAPIQNTNIMTQPLLAPNMTSSNNKFLEAARNKVFSGRKDLTVIINQLRKTFYVCCHKNIRAVNDLYLALEENEKFGLLGFNGSGKTTTFKAITNEIFIDRGTITLFGLDNKKDFESIRKSIGYCPQENALFPQLTVREVISFFKNLKGLSSSTEDICEQFGLRKYMNTKTSHLSGGNKRKLIFAIALMGNPSLLLLDEPSTGVDPESRRIMWKNINQLSGSKTQYNMILTTHSMEEAEILCDTVSWLKNGNFACIGNPEQLKIEFSAGYSLYVKFIENRDLVYDSNTVINNMSQMLPNVNFGQLMENQSFVNHAYQLLNIITCFRPFTKLIEIREIGKDMSFMLNVITENGKEGQLFSSILKQKLSNENISEITIGMKSLEDILTCF